MGKKARSQKEAIFMQSELHSCIIQPHVHRTSFRKVNKLTQINLFILNLLLNINFTDSAMLNRHLVHVIMHFPLQIQYL